MRTKSPRVLANLPSLQAVASAANDLAQFVFREAGAAMLPDGRIIEVDAPCLLQWRRTRTSETLAAGNPAHDLRRLSVTVRSRGGASGSRQVHFGFPSGVESARPLVVRLSPDHPPGVP